jgi:hypothetical protein
MLIQETREPLLRRILMRLLPMLLCLAALSIAVAVQAGSFIPEYGSADENRERARSEAQKVLKDIGAGINIDGANIVRVGSSYAVDEDEIVAGDVVIIGGALTVEGTIAGNAAVIGGSMYLASSAVVKGDAVVIGGILETEEGATVVGSLVENPEQMIDLDELEEIDESGNVRIVTDIDLDDEGNYTVETRRAGEPSIEVEDGDVVKIGEDIVIGRGEMVDGDVVAVSADIRIEGEVTGDVVATAGDVELGPSAKIGGDVVSVFGDVEVAEGAEVAGDVVEVDLSGKHIVIKGSEGDVEISGAEMKARMMAEKAAKKIAKPGTVRFKISLHRPDARDVRITGSFIDWDPQGIRLTMDEDGTWWTYYDFPVGTHLYKFIVDGEAMADPDEPDMRVEDGKGGYATRLMAVPPGSEMVPIRFSLYRPQADDVRVTGTFNGWDAEGVRMIKDEDGTWAATVPIMPGKVLYQFYIDGEWGPDPDVAERVEDGRGGWATPFMVKPRKKAAAFDLSMGSKEMDRAGNSFNAEMDYNRVDGLYLAALIKNESNLFPMPRFHVEGGRSWKRDRWLYTVEIEQPILAPFLASVGGSFYDKTDTYDKEIISDDENFISSSFVKRDYRDYFDRRGAGAFVALRLVPRTTFKVGYVSDEYRPLRTRAHSAIFRRNSEFAPNPHNPAMDDPFEDENIYQICYDPETGEQVCKMIAVKAMTASYELDLRDCKDCPSRGLLARLDGEWAGYGFGGDLEYSRYIADVRFYNSINPKMKYAIRLKGGGMSVPEDGSCGCVPEPQYFFPKQFYVGGIGTLPGYDYKEFRGTHMVLMNFEYQYLLKGGFGLLFFVDGGDARGEGESAADVIDAMKIKYDAGIAFRIESNSDHVLTFGVAQRLDDSDEPMLVTMRASRPF